MNSESGRGDWIRTSDPLRPINRCADFSPGRRRLKCVMATRAGSFCRCCRAVESCGQCGTGIGARSGGSYSASIQRSLSPRRVTRARTRERKFGTAAIPQANGRPPESTDRYRRRACQGIRGEARAHQDARLNRGRARVQRRRSQIREGRQAASCARRP
jgi:hypothetical protein